MAKNYTALERLYGKRLFEGTIDKSIIPESSRKNAAAYSAMLKKNAVAEKTSDEEIVTHEPQTETLPEQPIPSGAGEGTPDTTE